MTYAASTGMLADGDMRDRWEALERQNVFETPFSNLGYVEDLAAVLERGIRATFVSETPGEGDSRAETAHGSDGPTHDAAGILVLEAHTLGRAHVSPAGFTPFSAIAARSFPSAARIHARTSWLDALIASLGQRYWKTDIMLPPELEDVRPFQWARWTVSPLYTFRLTLDDPERGIASWSEAARRVYSRMKERYELHSDARLVRDVVQLSVAGYERSDRNPPLPPDRLEELARRQLDRGAASCHTLHANGDAAVEAGVVVLGRAPNAFYWIAGSVPGPGMTVLIGNLMQVLSEQGYRRFDLVGANTPSIAEFKRRLNPELVPYFRARRVRSRFLRVLLSTRDAMRT